MCAKKEPREVLQPLADLDAELREDGGVPLRDLVFGGERPNASAWVGGLAYFGLLESV